MDFSKLACIVPGMPLIDPSIWFTLTEAADYLSLTKTRVSVLVRQGRIPYERVNRMIYIKRSDAETFKSIPRMPGRPAAKPKRGRKG